MSCDQDCNYGPIKEIPMTENFRYCKNFSPDQLEEIEEFFKEFNFVVIREIASDELLDEMENELKQIAGLPNDLSEIDFDSFNWKRVYGTNYNMGKGFVGFHPAIGSGVTKLRQSENVQNVFSKLLHRKDLYAKLDRYGLMRPTKGRPQFKTEKGFVHWDQNPLSEPNFSRIQGVVTLSEHTPTSGGFHVVPGFVKHFENYAQKMYKKCTEVDDLVPVDVDEGKCLINNHLTRIYAPRGSLIIWDSRSPHGNWPNADSEEWRKVLYMTFFPQPDDLTLRDVRRREMNNSALADMHKHLNETGRRLFALDEYPDSMLPSDEEKALGVDMNATFSNRQNGL